MDVLNNIALPQSAEHVRLLFLIFNLGMGVLVPYLALLTGAVVVAVRADRRGRDTNDPVTVRFARDLLHAVLPSKSVFMFLAVIPALSLVFVLAQVLQGTDAASPLLAALGFLCVAGGGIAAFASLYTFRLAQLFAAVHSAPAQSAELSGLEAEAERTHRRSGTAAVAFLLLASFAITAAVSVAVRPASWMSTRSLLDVLLDGSVWLAWFLFCSVAAAMVGAAVLFFLRHDEAGDAAEDDPAYRAYVRRQGLRLLVVALLLTPVMLLLHLLVLPEAALSGGVFLLAGMGILLFFLALHFVYAFARSLRSVYPAFAFASVVLGTVLFVVKDQVALQNATQVHAAVMAHAFAKEAEALRTSLGIAAKQLTGEDIFNAKCSACHAIDQKKVGPAYASVLPKYEGKKPELVAYILNPRKIDPAYPPMPAQGLKPSEADSIAAYLIQKVLAKGS